jgi:hypothetical protein
VCAHPTRGSIHSSGGGGGRGSMTRLPPRSTPRERRWQRDRVLRAAAAFDPPNQPDEPLDPVLGEDGVIPWSSRCRRGVAEYVGSVTAAVVRSTHLPSRVHRRYQGAD